MEPLSEQEIHRNNFDLLRLFAATQVAYLHVAENLEVSLRPPLDALARVLHYFPGVPIFFVISGFLISASYERKPDVWSYAVNRFLRIYPALWVSTLLTLVLLILFGQRAWYAIEQAGASPTLIVSKWLAAQFSIGQFYSPHLLNVNYGVGHLNGSLWTIPVELQFYMVLPILAGWLWLRSSRARGNAHLTALALVMYGVSWLYARWQPEIATFSENLAVIARVTLLPYLYMFVLGIILQRNRRALSPWFVGKGVLWLALYILVALVLEFALGVPPRTNTPDLLSMSILAIAVVSLAFTRADLSERMLKGNDISYGTYIYHMVIANLAFELGFRHTTLAFLGVLAASFGIAIVSWVTIERPALSLKRRALLARG